MAKDTKTSDLARLIDDLKKERQHHAEQLERIDQTFRDYGISVNASRSPRSRASGKSASASSPSTPSRKKKTTQRRSGAARGRRRRQRYSQTAEQFIESMLQNKQPLTTRDIKDAWRDAGRRGTPDNTLSRMSRQGRIKRESLEGVRGSQYRPA